MEVRGRYRLICNGTADPGMIGDGCGKRWWAETSWEACPKCESPFCDAMTEEQAMTMPFAAGWPLWGMTVD